LARRTARLVPVSISPLLPRSENTTRANVRSLALGPPPEGSSIEQQDLGWANNVGTGNGDDAVTSGLEVIWSKTPTNWSNGTSRIPLYYLHVLITLCLDYLNSLFHNTWTLTKSPAGALQYESFNSTVDYPDPFNGTFRHATMLVSDLALRVDPTFSAIAESWVNNFPALTNAFANAWCKSLVS
jgi:catalase-peroxidase